MQRRRILLAIACVPLLQCATATPPPEPEPIATPLPPPPPPPEPEPEPQPEPIAIAPIVEPPPPEPPPPPPPPRHYKALIIGDSMAATDFGVALEKQLDAHRYISCVRWGKSATGLARPDYFDWMRAGAKLVKRHSPDLVIVIIGGNDGQDLLQAKRRKNGSRVFWKTDEWKTAYTDRIRRFLELLIEEDRRVLWLELPLMDHNSLEDKLELIREVQKAAVESIEGATWISTRRYFVDRRGKLVRKKKIKGWKRPQPLRQEDGIHFTVPGAHFFAERVYPDILSVLGL